LALFYSYLNKGKLERKDMNDRVELIENLFKWSRETPILDSKGEQIGKVYQRLCGDADIQKARITALRYSRELRIKFKDKNSDEFLAYVDGYNDLNKSQLTDLILFNELISIRDKVEKGFNFPFPKEPDIEANTEDWEEYQSLQDTYESRRLEKLNELLTKEIQNRREELESESFEFLQDAVILSKISGLCENELKVRFMEMVTYLGTFRDKKMKKRAFSSFQDFLDAPDILKNQLMEGYNSLEISSINLKEFQETQPLDQK
jgi:hypothetical protein